MSVVRLSRGDTLSSAIVLVNAHKGYEQIVRELLDAGWTPAQARLIVADAASRQPVDRVAHGLPAPVLGYLTDYGKYPDFKTAKGMSLVRKVLFSVPSLSRRHRIAVKRVATWFVYFAGMFLLVRVLFDSFDDDETAAAQPSQSRVVDDDLLADGGGFSSFLLGGACVAIGGCGLLSRDR